MATQSETSIVENTQTEAAIAESPFLQSFGDALKNAESEAQAKRTGVAPAKATDPAPAPVKVESIQEKKPTLPEFKKNEKVEESVTPDDMDVPAEIKSPKAAEQLSLIHI